MKTNRHLALLMAVAALAWTAGCGSGGTEGSEDLVEDVPAGQCQFWQDCDDGNPCTSHECVEGLCVTTARTGKSCDDGNICTGNDQCLEDGSCEGDLASACENDNPCRTTSCDPVVGCIYGNLDSSVACDDGDLCTLKDHCQDGVCVAGDPKECVDDDPSDCRVAICDPEFGECMLSSAGMEGMPCDDENPCTVEDECDSDGLCFGGKPLICETNEVCRKTWCDEKTPAGQDPCVVEWTEEGGKCDDLDVCTMLDHCVTAGDKMECVGEAVDCSTNSFCATGSCVQGQGCVYEAIHEGESCEEKAFHFCTQGECVCQPQCEGIQCGDDSCGGVCGVCPEDSKCFQGMCLDPGVECVDGNSDPNDGCFNGEIGEFVVSDPLFAGVSNPDVVARADGSYWIVWRGAGGTAVWLRGFTTHGAALGPAIQVNTDVDGTLERPRLGKLKNESIVVVWADFNSNKNRVYARILDGDSQWVGAPFEVSAGTGNQQRPAVDGLDDGNFVVVWDREDPAAGASEVRMRRYTPQGGAITDYNTVDTLEVSAFRPRVSAMPLGGYAIVWEQLMGLGGDTMPVGVYTSAYGRAYSSSGEAVGQVFNGWTGRILGSTNPMAIPTTAGVAMFWNVSLYDIFGVWTIHGRLFGVDGTPADSAFPVSSAAGTVCRKPDAVATSEQAWVVWEQGDDVVARRFLLNFSPVEPTFPLATMTDGTQEDPAVAVLANGDFLAVWRGELPSGGGSAIYAQRFSPEGEKLYQ